MEVVENGKMTEKQRRFADEYIISGIAEEAALRAGYSESYARARASELLANVGIKSYIAERMAVLEKKKIAKADEVLKVFTAILRQELTEELIQLNPVTGELVKAEKKPSISEVIKAGSELMKRYPMALEVDKLRLEVEKLRQQVAGSGEAEEHMAEYFERLQEVLTDGQGSVHQETD